MGKRKLWISVLFSFCCFCLFTGRLDASAAEVKNINKLAYVDADSKSLVLQFEGFSKKNVYTYTISSGGKTIQSGEAQTTGVYSLGELYKENSKYVLKITSAEKATLTVRYYTGRSARNFKAAQASDKVKGKWTLDNKSAYSRYHLYVFKEGKIKPKLHKKVLGGDTNVITIAASGLANGDYRAVMVGCRDFKSKVHYGQGMTFDLTYVKAPAKVTGVTVKPDTNQAKITWSPAKRAAYYRVYRSTSSAGKYSLVQDNVAGTSCVIKKLKSGKKYYFKVEAVGEYKTRVISGKKSAAKSVKIPVVAGKVKNVKLGLNSKDELAVLWDNTKNATSYAVYYKDSSQKTYKKLGSTKKKSMSLDKLTENKNYMIVVYAVTKTGSGTYKSSTPSEVLTINPVKEMNENYNKLLASKVRSIGYVGTTRCVYTTKKYSKAVKTAFVNSRGYSSSSKYLIWISHYTQQVSIFEGKKGDWRMIRTFTVATGTAKNHSPRGTFKIGKKEKGWFYVSTKELYVTHYCGRNSFHTRPLWNSGEVQNPTIGKPASHGCVRCYNSDAKYIYDNMPRGTTVVSY